MMTIDGTFYFTVSSTSCKVHLLVTPEILLEHFKTPTAKKIQVGKEYVQVKCISSIFCNINQVTKLEKIDQPNIITLTLSARCCYYLESSPLICTLIWCHNIVAALG